MSPRRSSEKTGSAPSPEAAGDSRAGDVLLLPVALAAFWTIAYQLVLVARWPAQSIVWCFLVISLTGLLLLLRL